MSHRSMTNAQTLTMLTIGNNQLRNNSLNLKKKKKNNIDAMHEEIAHQLVINS